MSVASQVSLEAMRPSLQWRQFISTEQDGGQVSLIPQAVSVLTGPDGDGAQVGSILQAAIALAGAMASSPTPVSGMECFQVPI
jgi:hypothetical protein